MKQSVNFSMFCDAFNNMGRGDNFSYYGLKALFNYLEELEDDMGEEMELDEIALCCEYVDEALEYLKSNTTVIEFDCGIIIQDF